MAITNGSTRFGGANLARRCGRLSTRVFVRRATLLTDCQWCNCLTEIVVGTPMPIPLATFLLVIEPFGSKIGTGSQS